MYDLIVNWEIFWLIVFFGLILKIPIAAACWLVWHATRSVPDPPEGSEPVEIIAGRDQIGPYDPDGAELMLDFLTSETAASRHVKRQDLLERSES